MGIQYTGVGRLSTVQNVSYTSTAGTITNPVGSQTYKVRVLVTTDAWITIDDNPTATTTTSTYLPALEPEYFAITPGMKVSAVQVSAGGSMNVTECA